MKHCAIVDGANLAYAERGGRGRPKIANLMAIRAALEERGFDVTIFVDASLARRIDDPDRLRALIGDGEIIQSPAGTEADEAILEMARERDAVVVSNDRFRDWVDEFPWIDERRVGAIVVDGRAQLRGLDGASRFRPGDV